MDAKKIGLTVEVVDAIPASSEIPAIRRSYFDTRKFGKVIQGMITPTR